MDLLVMWWLAGLELMAVVKSEQPLILNKGLSQSIGHGTKRVSHQLSSVEDQMAGCVELRTDSGREL